ncbi:MAG: IS1 family transposase [Bacteroidota bacterium]
MKKTLYDCPKCVGEYSAIKYGKTNQGKQRYKCKKCSSTFLKSYSYKAYETSTNSTIKVLLKEGVGIRSSARIIGISKNTVISRILKIASRIKKPFIPFGRAYELDELCTFIQVKKKGRYWLAYAIDKQTRDPVDFKVGKRTNKTLRHVVNTLLLSKARRIYTDKLRNYKYLIPEDIHCTKWRGTNGIENKNLCIRTHLRRLQKKTICFSKTQVMLVACLKIFFWG